MVSSARQTATHLYCLAQAWHMQGTEYGHADPWTIGLSVACAVKQQLW